METCTVETGLLKKKPCGEASVTHCANCEQPLCAKHAVPQIDAGRRTGKFLCKECSVAHREHEKAVGVAPLAEKPKAATPAAKPAAAVPAAPPGQPKTPAAAPAKAPPADEKSGPNFGAIDFTPGKPDDKK
jgi:hypothetical protein